MNNAVYAILKAHIDGVLKELLFKTSAEQVYLNDKDTLAPKLAEMVAAINNRVKIDDMNAALEEMTPQIAQSVVELLTEGNSGVILEEKSYGGFFGATATTGETVYLASVGESIKFYVGEKYTVVFDGVSYECEAETYNSSGVEQIGFSNYPYGSSGSDWFMISYGTNVEEPHGAAVATLIEGDSHTIGIYKSGGTRFLTDEDMLAIRSHFNQIEKQVQEIKDNPFTFEDITPEQLEALKGADGKDGKSAYDIALETGFVGTKEEWIASLKGNDGADGKDGANGKDGADGKDGTNGKDGADGKDYVLTDTDMSNIAQMAAESLADSGYIKGVACTQAEYDAMVAAGTLDSTTLYAIVG